MPTTPNPTSGFLFFVEKSEVTILDITVEEAAKLVISAGLVTPQQLREADASVAKEEDTLSLLLTDPVQVLDPSRKPSRPVKVVAPKKKKPDASSGTKRKT